MFQKIQHKVMALIAIVLVTAITTVSSVTYFQTKDVIDQSTRIEANNAVNEITRYTNQYLSQIANQVNLYSTDARVIDYLNELHNEDSNLITQLEQSIATSFIDYTKLMGSVELIYIGSETKTMNVTPLIPLPEDFDPTGRPWYIEAQNNPGEVIWTDPYETEGEEGGFVVTAAKAVFEPRTDQLLGVVGIDLSLNDLATIIHQVQVNHDGYTSLFDASGTALVHPSRQGENLSEDKAIEMMLSQADGNIDDQIDGQQRLIYFSTVQETGWKVNAIYNYHDMLKELYDIRTKVIIISVVMLVLSLVIAYFVSRNITKPIKNLKEHVSQISQGDLTVKAVSSSKDEIGQLTMDFNEMVDQMKQLIESAQHSANEVNMSAESLSALSEESTASSEEVAAAVTEIANGASNQVEDVEDTKKRTFVLSGQIEKVATETHHMQKIAVSTKNISKDGTMKVDTLLIKTNEANEVFATVDRVIKDLSGKISEIDQVIDTINGISEQTNLLALNASIEAARAGEHGRGFSVVASEVRKLAEQSRKATEGVRKTINGIVSQSEKVLTELTTTKDIFQQQTEAVDETQSSFKQIVISVEEIVTSLALIRTEAEQMSDQKNLVVDSIQNIAAVAEQASASAQEVAAAGDQQIDALSQVAVSAEQLNHSSLQLLELIKKFKVK
ncbi:methyl-accepting chemotaxis protein [Halalkalibacter krulwichiae]|uniref:Methyl-accepting chemotaxis protein McpC n=1 Tax=Halalkalibacter krulwichiae TaxID=199441 RepID=A0A1X9MGK6_9BACI|nr:methyl-accepting chemotaxis protein [Halalkalibacter krulwichiae]ARK29572.1 Methyl-accepting chemotaxis protein McpC [Halalkalibacter krulwichiae]